MIINSPGNHSSPVVRIQQQTLQWLNPGAVDEGAVEEKVFGWLYRLWKETGENPP